MCHTPCIPDQPCADWMPPSCRRWITPSSLSLPLKPSSSDLENCFSTNTEPCTFEPCAFAWRRLQRDQIDGDWRVCGYLHALVSSIVHNAGENAKLLQHARSLRACTHLVLNKPLQREGSSKHAVQTSKQDSACLSAKRLMLDLLGYPRPPAFSPDAGKTRLSQRGIGHERHVQLHARWRCASHQSDCKGLLWRLS